MAYTRKRKSTKFDIWEDPPEPFPNNAPTTDEERDIQLGRILTESTSTNSQYSIRDVQLLKAIIDFAIFFSVKVKVP